MLPIARKGSPDALIAIITGYRMIADERGATLQRAFSGEARADMWLPKTSESLCDTLCSIILLVARGNADRQRRIALEPLDKNNREVLGGGVVPKGTIFACPVMVGVIAKAIQVARHRSIPIFILGPSGTGKKHLLEIIKNNDVRGPRIPWINVNCATISRDSNSQISYLFGYKKGDFTGAQKDELGAVRSANGGNLVLDEVHHLSKEAQAALLHAIDQGEMKDFQDRPYNVTLRDVAASNKKRSELNQFLSPDFRNRLWAWIIEIPSLNTRRDDIAQLARAFVLDASRNLNKLITINPSALAGC